MQLIQRKMHETIILNLLVAILLTKWCYFFLSIVVSHIYNFESMLRFQAQNDTKFYTKLQNFILAFINLILCILCCTIIISMVW